MANRFFFFHTTSDNFQSFEWDGTAQATENWDPGFADTIGATANATHIYLLDDGVNPPVARRFTIAQAREASEDIALDGGDDADQYTGLALTDTHLVATNKTKRRLEYYSLATGSHDSSMDVAFTAGDEELEGICRGGDHLFVIDNATGNKTIFKRNLDGSADSSWTYLAHASLNSIVASHDNVFAKAVGGGAILPFSFDGTAGTIFSIPAGPWVAGYATYDPPTAPQNLTLTARTRALVAVWTAPATANGLTHFEISTDGTTWINVGNVLTHRLTNLPAESTTVQVRAVNRGGASTAVSATATPKAQKDRVYLYEHDNADWFAFSFDGTRQSSDDPSFIGDITGATFRKDRFINVYDSVVDRIDTFDQDFINQNISINNVLGVLGIAHTDTHIVGLDNINNRLRYWRISDRVNTSNVNLGFGDWQGICRGGDHLFVVESLDDKIYKRNLDGSAVSDWSIGVSATFQTIFATRDRVIVVPQRGGVSKVFDFDGGAQTDRTFSVPGSSALVQASFVTFTGLPAAPTGLTLTPTGTTIVAEWTAPTDTGDSAIVVYAIRHAQGTSIPDSTQWTLLGSAATSHTIRNLDKNTQYTVEVRAVNTIGEGAASEAVMATTSATAPDAPTGLTVGAITRASVALSWTAPSGTGGQPITGYEVRWAAGTSIPANTAWTATGSDDPEVIVGNLNGQTQYTFQVRAVNATGSGESSTTVSATTANLTAPSAPENFTVVLTATGATLTWDVPVDNGGSAITDYEWRHAEGSSIPNTTAWTSLGRITNLQVAISQLAKGTEYTFEVRAVNSVGNGATRSSTDTTSTTVPGMPTGLTLTATRTKIQASWVAPTDTGGLQITDYRIRHAVGTTIPTNTVWVSAGTTLEFEITALTRDTQYAVEVIAVNSHGESVASGVAIITTTLTITATAPASNVFGAETFVFTFVSTGPIMLVQGNFSVDIGTIVGLVEVTAFRWELQAQPPPTGMGSITATLAMDAVDDGNDAVSATANYVENPQAPVIAMVSEQNILVDMPYDLPVAITNLDTANGDEAYARGELDGYESSWDQATGMIHIIGEPDQLVSGKRYNIIAKKTIGTSEITRMREVIYNVIPAAPVIANFGPVTLYRGVPFYLFIPITNTPTSVIATGAWARLETRIIEGGVAIFGTQSPASEITVDSDTIDVVASNLTGEHTNSGIINFSQGTPPAMNAVTPVAGNTQASFSWAAVTDALSYAYRIGSGEGAQWVDVGNVTSHTIDNLNNGQLYTIFWRVNSAWQGTPVSVQVTPVGDLSQAMGVPGNMSIRFTWNAVPGATSYAFRVGETGNWTDVGNVTEHVVTGLTNDVEVTVYWRVNSPIITTPIAVKGTPMATVPGKVTGLTATVSGTTISLSWDAPDNGGSPIIRYNLEQNGSIIINPTGTSSTRRNLSTGTYRYRVRAVNAEGNGEWSDEVSAEVSVRAPSAPRNVRFTNGIDASGGFSWDAPSDNGGDANITYDWRNDGGVWGTHVVPASATTPGNHTFEVRAHNSGGTSPIALFSYSVAQPVAPSAPSLSGFGITNGVTLVITPGSDGGSPIIRYELQVNRNAAWINIGTSTIYTHPINPINSGTPVWWQVRAVNLYGTSPPSNEISVASL